MLPSEISCASISEKSAFNSMAFFTDAIVFSGANPDAPLWAVTSTYSEQPINRIGTNTNLFNLLLSFILH